VQGPSGWPGDHYLDSIGFRPIDAAEFEAEMTKPAIVTVSNGGYARQGDVITATGRNFSQGDLILAQDAAEQFTVECDTRVVSPTLLTFRVPALQGGSRAVRDRRADGTLSNRASLYVLPVLTSAQPGGKVRPGTTVTLEGSGFAPDSLVRVNGQEMPDVAFLDPNHISFTLVRPDSVVENPAGERVSVKVVLADGTPSNEIPVVLDTFRMLVLGDSIPWGQGLQEHQKFHSLVQTAVKAREGKIGAYKTVLAHSGATIGVGDNTSLPPISGEVPTSYPTIMQQCNAFTDAPETVDLVLVNGGLNDINIRNVLNPGTSVATVIAATNKYCYEHMKQLLQRITTKFPNSRVVVTGYYPIVTADSDIVLLEVLLTVMGVSLAGIAGGITAAGVKPKIVQNCRTFAEHSTAKLQAAVEDVNDSLPGEPRVFFANPMFSTQNAALAPDAWLWGVNGDFSPQDNLIAGSRWQACELNRRRTDLETCRRASAGHPNQRGAQEYASSILAALEDEATGRLDKLPPFPEGFLWGVATSAYQVEGGIEGNDWHIFTTSPAIKRRVSKLSSIGGGSSIELQPAGDAVRHSDLNTLREDLDRAQLLGMNAYRFSLEWSRIQPNRPSSDPPSERDFDGAALAYYGSIIDEILKRGMKPIVTLNHLSLPQWVLTPPRESSALSILGWPTAVPDAGFNASLRGWEYEATVYAFVRFVSFVVGQYKDRVDHWLTVNEPVGSMVGLGYIAGIWPPGFTGGGAGAKKAHLNLIKAHVRAYNEIKRLDPGSQVGFAHAMMYARVTSTPMSLGVGEAARNQFDYFYNYHFLEAVINGRVDVNVHRRPANQRILQGQELEQFFGFHVDDAHPWRPTVDFIGLNYYRSVYVFYDQLVATFADFSGGRFENNLQGKDEPHNLLNNLGWEIYPEGLYSILKSLHERYHLPILITENGMPEKIDVNRAAYIVAHLQHVLRAIKEGVDVRGYIHWTLVDNWELQEGYREEARFGIFQVDRTSGTLPRHITEGALALQHVISEGALGQAVEKFGAISPLADRVRPMREPAEAIWEGTLDADRRITLYLSRLTDAWSGMIFFQDLNRWTLLEEISWQPENRRLSFSHGAHAAGAARQYEAIAANGLLTGTFTEGGSTYPWSAERLRPCGVWTSGSLLARFQLSRREGDYGGWFGKYLVQGPLARWQAFRRVEWDGATLRLGIGDLWPQFTGIIDGDTIRGKERYTTGSRGGQTIRERAWEAKRIPDDIPL
jgi:beta-glucosidase/6-phospho-beta-glucosidase/beta-galactosidase/lysophospholipase L1-like esterase